MILLCILCFIVLNGERYRFLGFCSSQVVMWLLKWFLRIFYVVCLWFLKVLQQMLCLVLSVLINVGMLDGVCCRLLFMVMIIWFWYLCSLVKIVMCWFMFLCRFIVCIQLWVVVNLFVIFQELFGFLLLIRINFSEQCLLMVVLIVVMSVVRVFLLWQVGMMMERLIWFVELFIVLLVVMVVLIWRKIYIVGQYRCVFGCLYEGILCDVQVVLRVKFWLIGNLKGVKLN